MAQRLTTATQDKPVNIVGLVIHIDSTRQKPVFESLSKITGLEIYAEERGRVIATLDEAESEQAIVDSITQLNNIPGVLSTSIAYHHFEGTNQQPVEKPDNQERAL
ncbi:chaperone NapD [Aliikangiella sp. G2MR2-5]|uniref:chaperone NapD n=1 Tax=Aliikangiella sp. G2MR2-5 TaxID=2788943 RepID=UPI0018AB5F78|nr:chaperone NapD [Aliikangiella sp. G2MR2-5]